MEYLKIDGAMGEGGGQVLRLATTFSVIQQRPIKVFNIRAGRRTPGLMRQHVSTLQVLAKVFGADLGGATEGSSEVSFAPGKPGLRELSIDMGTAASITLVLQAVVPAAALSRASLSLELRGGTDVPWSPTFDYFETVVREAFKAVGMTFEASAARRGYYPKGGGRVTASVESCDSLKPLNPTGAAGGEVSVVSRCARLPSHVAERQLAAAVSVLEEAGFRPERTKVTSEDAESPGSSILACRVGGGSFLGADALGARGRPSEDVGTTAASKLVKDVKTGALLDSNAADMVIPLLSLASGPSAVRISSVSPHLETGVALARAFTGCRFETRKDADGWAVSVLPEGEPKAGDSAPR